MDANRDQNMDLVDRALGGDQLALEELLLTHYDRLQRHVAGRVSQLPLHVAQVVGTEDVLQQAFTKAFAAAKDFKPRDEYSFYAWLRRIADNQLNDLCRKRGRERVAPTFRPANVLESTTVEDLLDQFVGDAVAPSDGAMRTEAFRMLRMAIAELPDEYREVIELHDIRGQDLNSIASKLDRTVASVRSLRHRALKKLQSELVRLSRLM